jgi:5-formyltetrahydrofolate cyclo-ligase
MRKAELRKIYSEKRKKLSPTEYDKLNEKLLAQFSQLDFSKVESIHLYLPIQQKKEPNTFLIRAWLAEAFPQIKRVFPKADFADYSMQHFLDDEKLEIVENAMGIPEPVNGTLADLNDASIVIVPLLAFDQQGFRVGYGKGFYDRFLMQFPARTRFIGLSYFDPVDEIEDRDAYDIALHSCITPEKIWNFQI